MPHTVTPATAPAFVSHGLRTYEIVTLREALRRVGVPDRALAGIARACTDRPEEALDREVAWAAAISMTDGGRLQSVAGGGHVLHQWNIVGRGTGGGAPYAYLLACSYALIVRNGAGLDHTLTLSILG